MDINVYQKLPEPEPNKEYKITKVEQGKGQYGEYIRVTLEDNDKKQYSTALWIKDTVSAKSKAGAFAIALGNNPEEWEGKRIKIISWTAKNREIQEKHYEKIYRVYRQRVSLNVSEIKTNYVKVSVDIRKENGKTIYTFTVQPIE